jgi:hypothetical protein
MEHFIQFANLLGPTKNNDFAFGLQLKICLRIDDIVPVGFDIANDGTSGFFPKVEIA